MQGIIKKKNPHGIRVIPGFGLTLGVTLSMLSCLVLIPLASIIWSAGKLSPAQFFAVVTSKQVMSGYAVSLSCALTAALINVVFGVILAWVLVRYEFPGKRLLDGMIELPFALPTAVAGISLTTLYSDQGWVGALFAKAGIKIAYTRAGITIAMIFIGIPFVVRSVQPVLVKLDRSCEEAAQMLGAGRTRTFFKVIAGNIPYKTQIAPLLIMSKLEQYKYNDATAIAVVLLILSFVIMLLINSVQVYMQRFQGGAENGGSLKKVVEAYDKDSHSAVKWGLIGKCVKGWLECLSSGGA